MRQSRKPPASPTDHTPTEEHRQGRGPTAGPLDRAKSMTRTLRTKTRDEPVHPALIPGIGVDKTGRSFTINRTVLAVAGALTAAVVVWGFAAPGSLSDTGTTALAWVMANFSWLFGSLAIVVAIFMLVVGYGPTAGITLGEDDEKPEFSMISWIAMLFSAGIGIGLLFYGPYEPLTYFLEPPHGFDDAPGSADAMQTALAQTMLHWGPVAWAMYALVGGAIAYSSYRRGRPPLISAIFEPVFGPGRRNPLGATIDIFAIIVTLFGTAVSLGIGVLQISRGFQVVSGAGPVGNGFLVGLIAGLTALFVLSAVSGVKRGIRALSNVNMALAGALALFVFVVGPTVFLLNLLPSAGVAFVDELGTMLARNPDQGEDAAAFMSAWTTYYWAWWVSWTPFVGLFIARISRGRTLRQFVTVVIMVPSAVCLVWFTIVGGTSMWMESRGDGISEAGSPEAMLFEVLGNLPFGGVLSVIAMVSIIIFFVTSADSASIVMASLSQNGKPLPSKRVTIMWGVALGLVACSLLLAGGQDALSGLQAIMVVSALPFAVVVVGVMVAWAKDLRNDPYMLRNRYAKTAIDQGVRRAIEDHGDDFVFGSDVVPAEEGAGAWLDTDDPALTEWYVEAQDDSVTEPAKTSSEPALTGETAAVEAIEAAPEPGAIEAGPAGRRE
ncbi:BCCT family transporter [Sanguibacter sp. Leaf3]|uniref:BCCT family transporter n=1 Tax=Sanguibacter sp. Leaf3 TaxID=1736209 RepID=UPI0006F519A2|nr:BCCT family transporter [Sanguibacter sp. Leaf3]KQT96448.1 choline transporter [Sanguibacter sp. Leaf3]